MQRLRNWLYFFLFILLGLFISIIPNIPLPFPFPVRLSNLFISLYARFSTWLPFIFLIGLIISGLTIVFFKKARRRGVKLLFFLFILIAITYICTTFLSPSLQDYSKGYAIKNVTPLLDVLEKFKKENNDYPDALTLLVPKYIDKIPSTKVLTIRNVEYKKNSGSYTMLMLQYTNGWDVDVILYNPDNLYDIPESQLKTFGNWRYYHINK